jgi:hypothetical protein
LLKIKRTRRQQITDDTIRDRAYEIYEARGVDPGRDMDDWLLAERELRPTRAA